LEGTEVKRLPKQTYTLEFKQEAIRRMEVEGKKQADVARELGIIEQTLHGWRKAHRQGKLAGATSNCKPISEEQMELSRVRAENARLKMEVEILKKATAYFAKEHL
jgi:transposase